MHVVCDVADRASELSHAIWRKSTRSNDGGDGPYVEVAELTDRVAMRDSKDPAGPVLAFTHTERPATTRLQVC